MPFGDLFNPPPARPPRTPHPIRLEHAAAADPARAHTCRADGIQNSRSAGEVLLCGADQPCPMRTPRHNILPDRVQLPAAGTLRSPNGANTIVVSNTHDDLKASHHFGCVTPLNRNTAFARDPRAWSAIGVERRHHCRVDPEQHLRAHPGVADQRVGNEVAPGKRMPTTRPNELLTARPNPTSCKTPCGGASGPEWHQRRRRANWGSYSSSRHNPEPIRRRIRRSLSHCCERQIPHGVIHHDAPLSQRPCTPGRLFGANPQRLRRRFAASTILLRDSWAHSFPICGKLCGDSFARSHCGSIAKARKIVPSRLGKCSRCLMGFRP